MPLFLTPRDEFSPTYMRHMNKADAHLTPALNFDCLGFAFTKPQRISMKYLNRHAGAGLLFSGFSALLASSCVIRIGPGDGETSSVKPW